MMPQIRTMKKGPLYWLSVTISTFSNWPQIYWRQLRGDRQGPWILRTWEGAVFEVAHKHTTLPTIVEVWHDRMYGDLKELSSHEAPVIIDIGGNIGSFALFALWNLPRARVYTYEPESSNYEHILRMMTINNVADRCQTFPYAVCGTKGTRTLHVAADNSGKSSLYAGNAHRATVSVPCTTLKDIFTDNAIESCDLLKIDCEGAEYDLLLNAPREIFTRIKAIVLEHHSVPGHSVNELLALFESCGYAVTAHEEHPSMLHASRTSS